MTTDPPRHVAVIDIGKTNAKIALVDMEGHVEIAVHTLQNRVRREGSYPHYDIDGLWNFILGALGKLHRERAIDAIAVTTHGATCALLDGRGDLAFPVLDYECGEPDALAGDYDAVRPDFEETGSPRLPHGLNLAAQIHWLERRFPHAFGKVATIVMYPQYWGFRLTGVAANEITSLGCHTDLWSPAAHDYSSLVDRLGWRPLFAPLRKATDRLGPIRPEIAAQTGLRDQTPVYCGIHDSNASLLPHLFCRRPPFSVVSTGTWVVSMAIGGTPAKLDPGRDTLINVNALGEPVPSARFMGGREFAVQMQGLEEKYAAGDIASVLSRKIFLLPSVQRGSGPFPNCEAEWLCDTEISPSERCAVVSLYLALMTSVCLDLIGAKGITLTEGPLAHNEGYVRMLAAATGREVIPDTEGGTGTSVGAALLTSTAPQPLPKHEKICANTDPLWTAYARDWLAKVNARRC
jgi:sugar (pentulose or hexulose) kinase